MTVVLCGGSDGSALGVGEGVEVSGPEKVGVSVIVEWAIGTFAVVKAEDSCPHPASALPSDEVRRNTKLRINGNEPDAAKSTRAPHIIGK